MCRSGQQGSWSVCMPRYSVSLACNGDLLLTPPLWLLSRRWFHWCFLSPPGRCHQHSVWLWCQAETSKWNTTLSVSTKGVGGAFELAWWCCAFLFPGEGSRSADCNLHERLRAPVWEVVAGQLDHCGRDIHRHCLAAGKMGLLSGCRREGAPRGTLARTWLCLVTLVPQLLRHSCRGWETDLNYLVCVLLKLWFNLFSFWTWRNWASSCLLTCQHFPGLSNTAPDRSLGRQGRSKVDPSSIKFFWFSKSCSAASLPWSAPPFHMPVRDRSAHFPPRQSEALGFFVMWGCDTFLWAQMECQDWEKLKKT